MSRWSPVMLGLVIFLSLMLLKVGHDIAAQRYAGDYDRGYEAGRSAQAAVDVGAVDAAMARLATRLKREGLCTYAVVSCDLKKARK